MWFWYVTFLHTCGSWGGFKGSGIKRETKSWVKTLDMSLNTNGQLEQGHIIIQFLKWTVFFFPKEIWYVVIREPDVNILQLRDQKPLLKNVAMMMTSNFLFLFFSSVLLLSLLFVYLPHCLCPGSYWAGNCSC